MKHRACSPCALRKNSDIRIGSRRAARSAAARMISTLMFASVE